MVAYKNLVLEGGGTKGFSYIGVAEALVKLNVLTTAETKAKNSNRQAVENIGGSSVGAIGALLLATGWSVEKMKAQFTSLDFAGMARGGVLGMLKMPYNASRKFGLHDANAFHDFFKEIVKEVTGNPNATFADWHAFKEAHPELDLKDIFVQACNLNTKENETFSYKSKHKNVPIADAIRASMAFPVYFSPYKINGRKYSDGGIQNNCPYSMFERKRGVFNPETLCVRLDDAGEIKHFEEGTEPPEKEIDNFFQCLAAQVECALGAQNYAFYNSPYRKNAIYCDTLDVSTLDFNLSDKKKEELRQSGIYGVQRFYAQQDPKLVEATFGKDVLKKIMQAKYCMSYHEYSACKGERNKTKHYPKIVYAQARAITTNYDSKRCHKQQASTLVTQLHNKVSTRTVNKNKIR